MLDIILKAENIRKAHAQGCRDVKKVLETLCPEVFGRTIPGIYKNYTTGLIVYIASVDGRNGSGWVLNKGDEGNLVNFYSTTWDMARLDPIIGIQEIPE